MKKVLVYPCGTEIGLEIERALRYSTHYLVYGGSSDYDHGRFVFERHLDGLPFITDRSSPEEIDAFQAAIEKEDFDFIYPAMDGVVTVFSRYRERLRPVVIAPDAETAVVTRSKRKTYRLLRDVIPVPVCYERPEEVPSFPVFVKPDAGQGSVGARVIRSAEELSEVDFGKMVCMERLPGEEFTVDCFTNGEGKLLYARGRGRKRIKNGISVNTVFVDNPLFREYGERINAALSQRGGWFFQLKEAEDGTLKLLEVASRIAGTSAISRCAGVNLPLLTVNVFDGFPIDSVMPNRYEIELDRALENVYAVQLAYDTVYFDYDDTLVERGRVNTRMMQFVYQCVNRGRRLILLSKHEGNLEEELRRYRIAGVFDEVIHLRREEQKADYVTEPRAIFVDDSYGERRAVAERRGIPVFDPHMIECLLEGEV